jgi:preprotein translocase subunit SecF
MAFSFAQFGNDLYSGRRSYNFVGHWRRWLGIGLITVMVCTLILVFKGLNPGIEFRGGSEFLISGVKTTDQSIATDIVTAAVCR